MEPEMDDPMLVEFEEDPTLPDAVVGPRFEFSCDVPDATRRQAKEWNAKGLAALSSTSAPAAAASSIPTGAPSIDTGVSAESSSTVPAAASSVTTGAPDIDTGVSGASSTSVPPAASSSVVAGAPDTDTGVNAGSSTSVPAAASSSVITGAPRIGTGVGVNRYVNHGAAVNAALGMANKYRTTLVNGHPWKPGQPFKHPPELPNACSHRCDRKLGFFGKPGKGDDRRGYGQCQRCRTGTYVELFGCTRCWLFACNWCWRRISPHHSHTHTEEAKIREWKKIPSNAGIV
ncbi:MAG: hypothetical protein Q9165_004850 [Trypethelium subeluteriae]